MHPEDTAAIPHAHSAEGHSDHHDHDDEHGHDEGPLGWLRHTFFHSHDVHARFDNAMESNERGIRALKISLVGLGATAIIQLAIVLLSGSTALLADTIHNFGDAATSFPLWAAFVLQRRPRSRRFTYGYGRTEDVAGVIIVLLIFASACVAAYESIRKLIDPTPVYHLWWVAIAAIVGFIGNEAVGMFRIRVGREIGSAALVADGEHSRVDGFTSLAVLVGAIGVALGAPILDPLIGLVITIAILFIVKDAAKAVVLRLLDGIEPEILGKIEQVPLSVSGVHAVQSVHARWSGHRVHSDLRIAVDPSLSIAEAASIENEVRQRLAQELPELEEVTIELRPST